jgi:hypothetical protein
VAGRVSHRGCWYQVGDADKHPAADRKSLCIVTPTHHLYLAGALGLRAGIDEARAALTEAIRLNPTVNSLAQWTVVQPCVGNPAFIALRDKPLDSGLRRAGMPND